MNLHRRELKRGRIGFSLPATNGRMGPHLAAVHVQWHARSTDRHLDGSEIGAKVEPSATSSTRPRAPSAWLRRGNSRPPTSKARWRRRWRASDWSTCRPSSPFLLLPTKRRRPCWSHTGPMARRSICFGRRCLTPPPDDGSHSIGSRTAAAHRRPRPRSEGLHRRNARVPARNPSAGG
jgi:hypothetical protein